MTDEPAFPTVGGKDYSDLGGKDYKFPSNGMTLRNYFAAKAMQAWIISDLKGGELFKDHAENAYLQADAMLQQMEKKRNED